MGNDYHDHDRGLAHDLDVMGRQILARRRALGWLASAGTAALLTGCGGDSTATSVATGATATPTPTPTPTPSSACSVPASETNGPYPADGTNTSSGATSNVLIASGAVRSDIRSSFFTSSTVADGVQLVLTITVVNANASCAPLAGYAVYLWHCNRNGLYSLYDTPGESYLRGIQVTNSAGQVTFTTIIPGCYAGRYPHMHFEIFTSLAAATSGRASVLTSQFAIPAAVCQTVYNGSALYATSISRFAAVSVASDNVFGNNTASQIAVMTPAISGSVAGGYTGTSTIGISV